MKRGALWNTIRLSSVLAARLLSVIFRQWPMISNFCSSENVPAYDGWWWGCLKSNCKFSPRWFRYGLPSFLIFLTIYVPILYLPTFSESNAWYFHLVMTGISGNVPATSEDFRLLSEDFRTLPKMSADVPKTFEHFRSYLKEDNFSVLWFR